MHTFRLLAFSLIALALPALAVPAGAQDATAAIRITRCRVLPPRPLSHRPSGTELAFVNVGPTLVHRVTFTIAYAAADGPAERGVTDVGTFAPNTPVVHRFDLYRDVLYARTPPRCAVTSAR